MSRCDIHYLVAHGEEFCRRETLREEIGEVVACAYIRYDDLSSFDAFTNVEMAAFDVLHPLVVLGIVGGVARRLVIAALRSRASGREAQLGEELSNVDYLLRRL